MRNKRIRAKRRPECQEGMTRTERNMRMKSRSVR